MDSDTEFITYDGPGASVASTAEPGPPKLRAYLLKEVVFQDLMQLKAKASYFFVPLPQVSTQIVHN
jgi:hypothetical protein